MAAPLIRIFSDLHFLESACRVKEIEQLRPLLEGADEMIFNGDLIDTQNADSDHTVTRELKAYFNAHAPTTFLTGNHDPDISETHEIQLADASVWLTHGDVLFDELVPWSRDLPEIRRRLQKAWLNIPVAEQARLETRLKTFRQICLNLPRDHDPRKNDQFSRVMRYFCVLFPPRCALALAYTWATMSHRASRLAAEHRPRARFVIFGHTHRPGVWQRRDNRIVINTGAFCGPLAGQAVELQGEQLRIRPIVLRGGELRLAPPTNTFALPSPALSLLSAHT